MNNDISQLSIRELLSGKVAYTIPMYQRNYAWVKEKSPNSFRT